MSQLQACVARAFEQALDMPEGSVGPEDNLFDLGGHSIHAVRALAVLRRGPAPDLDLAALFDAETVAELAALIETERATIPTAAPVLESMEF